MENILAQEYFKLVDIVDQFDVRLITIKSWGVTLSLATLALGFKEHRWGYFAVAVISAASFWYLEGVVKGHQMRYYPRMREIEILAAQSKQPGPRIDWSWEQAPAVLSGKIETPPNKLLRKTDEESLSVQPRENSWGYILRFFLPHVMFPHVITVVIGSMLTILAFRRTGHFQKYT